MAKQRIFTISSEESGPINPLKEFLVEHWTQSNYDRIYVSFGSKLNEFQQHFRWPTTTVTSTNANYQIIPEWLRVSEQRTLVLMIDRFRDQEDLKFNRQYIANQLDAVDAEMDIVMVDHTLTHASLAPLVELILFFVDHHQFSPKQCMFCNYIRFAHPNDQECAFEEYVANCIQRTMTGAADGKYADCFYQWYGPQFYLYHWMYPYKRYHEILAFYQSMFARVFCEALDSIPLRRDIGSVVELSLKTENERRGWAMFCELCIDITSIVQ
jgi:hypothetical protein